MLPLILHMAIRHTQKYQNPENQYCVTNIYRGVVFVFFIIFEVLIFLLLCLIFGPKFHVDIKCNSEVLLYLEGITQLAFTCSKTSMKTPKKNV